MGGPPPRSLTVAANAGTQIERLPETHPRTGVPQQKRKASVIWVPAIAGTALVGLLSQELLCIFRAGVSRGMQPFHRQGAVLRNASAEVIGDREIEHGERIALFGAGQRRRAPTLPRRDQSSHETYNYPAPHRAP